MTKQTLIIGGTHGDEPIGVVAIDKLKNRGGFDCLIGNPRACKKNKRYIQNDLNRSAPGDEQSDVYESRRAAQIIKKSKGYKYVIDIHGTEKDTGIFLIITNPKLDNWKLAAMLDVKRIVYWPAFSPELSGPLSEYYNCGLEIECGPKDNIKVQNQLVKILEKYLGGDFDDNGFLQKLSQKEIFQVYGSVENIVRPRSQFNEFQKTEYDGETFYSLLVGSYREVSCYKMKKIN